MALIRPIPAGSSTPNELTITINCINGSNVYWNPSQSEVDVLTAMGYNFVTTSKAAKQAISTSQIQIQQASGGNVQGVITFSKT